MSYKIVECISVDIEDANVDIQNKLKGCADKTIGHTILFFVEYGKERYFGRSDVERMIGLKSSGASKFIKLLLDKNVIGPIKGHGKGKYKFI